MPGYARSPEAIEDDLYVFTDESQRSTVLPSPTAGMLSYLTGVDEYQYYDGSSWKAIVDPTSFASVSDFNDLEDSFIDPYFLMGA